MRFTTLGPRGPKVARLAFGNWIHAPGTFEPERSRNLIRTAYDCGIRFFDTAPSYACGETEKTLGMILRDFPRNQLFIATKCYWPPDKKKVSADRIGLSEKNIFRQIEDSLKRLRVETVDLLQCHKYDQKTPVEETVGALNKLIRSGKIRHWGISNWNESQVRDAVQISKRLNCPGPTSIQSEYHMLKRWRDKKFFPICRREGLGVLIYSPFARGVLSGKYLDNVPKDSRAAVDNVNREAMLQLSRENAARLHRFNQLSAKTGVSANKLALAFYLKNPNIDTVIFGSSRPEQIRENASAVDWDPDPEIIAEMERIFHFPRSLRRFAGRMLGRLRRSIRFQ